MEQMQRCASMSMMDIHLVETWETRAQSRMMVHRSVVQFDLGSYRTSGRDMKAYHQMTFPQYEVGAALSKRKSLPRLKKETHPDLNSCLMETVNAPKPYIRSSHVARS